MNEQGKLPKKRAACDRCNAHKLRCPRPLLGDSCSRCLKADVPCAFSISKRGNGWRILGQQQGILESPLNDSTSADAIMFDTGGFSLTGDVDFDVAFANATVSGQIPLNDHTHLLESHLGSDMRHTYDQTTTNPLSSVELYGPTRPRDIMNHLESQQTSSENPMPASMINSAHESVSSVSMQSHEKYTRNLSIDMQLLVLFQDMLEHRKLIRHPSIHRDGLTFTAPTQKEEQHEQLPTADMNGSKAKPEKFSLDKTLLLTQRLLDIYIDVIAAIHSHTAQQKRSIEKALNDDIVDSAKFSSSAVEQSTVLLLLSCTHRILYIWELVSLHGTELIKYSVFKSPEWAENKKCGDVKFGSFAPNSQALLNAAMMPLITNTISSIERSLVQLSQSIQADPTNLGNQQHEESMANSDLLFNDLDSLSSLTPTCDKTLGLSRQLIQSLDRSKTIFSEAGLLK